MKTPRTYQQESLRRLAKDTSGLDGSDLGTGKTLVGVERVRDITFAGTAPRILVISPINTHLQWRDLFAEQYPTLGEDFLHIISTPGTTPEPWSKILGKQPGVFIIGWEAMRGTLPQETRKKGSTGTKKNPPVTVKAIEMAMRDGLIPPWPKTGTWDLVICDESHRLANRGSLQKKVLSKIKASHKLALSATAGGNRPEGLWSTLNWLWPARYTSFWAWARENMVIEQDQISRERSVETIQGEKHPGSTWTDIPCVVRHRHSAVAKELPKVIERVVTVPMGDVQRVQYEEFEDQALAWIDDQPVPAPLPITQRIRLRQAALGTLKNTLAWKRHSDWYSLESLPVLYGDDGVRNIRIIDRDIDPRHGWPTVKVSAEYEELELDFNEHSAQPKLKAIREIISDLPSAEPVIVFTHSSKWARMAEAELENAGLGMVRSWTGAVSGKNREALKRSMMGYRESGEGVRVLIAQVQALSEGVDGFQLGCCCEIWASPSEDQIINQQAMGRLHRSGQERPVQRWKLHSVDSIDVDLEATLALRRKRMSQMYRDRD